MDKKFIKVLIEEGTPLAEVPVEQAIAKLNNDIMTVYVMNGIHRNMQPESFREEVRACAAALYQELTTDRAYKSIRDKEIPYIFSNGMKGRLGTDKDIVLTYKSLLRWVEGYVKHQERKDALSQHYEEHRPKPPKLPPHELTDSECRRMVETAWEEFRRWKEAMRRKEPAAKGGVRTIGEILSAEIPISCYDYGKLRIGYLRRTGYASSEESLLDVFERALLNGGKLWETNRLKNGRQ